MSNFKDTVYSILNEDAGDTDQEIRRKANTAALMNKGLKGDELLVAIKEYDASKKRSAAEVSAAADNRGHEEAVGMVASGEATSMGDARNRMGVRDQVAAERARMAKNPVREVGIANPSSQIGGAGTQYGNSPNRAPETEAEIKYRTGTSAPTANLDPTKRNKKQDEKSENKLMKIFKELFPELGLRPPAGSEPGGWEGESQAMADLHNTPAWQKLWAAGQDPITRKNMEASQTRQDKGNTAIQTARDNGDSTLSGLEQKSRDTRLPSEGATTQNRRDHIDAIRAAEYEKGRLRRQANSKPSNGGEQPDDAGSKPNSPTPAADGQNSIKFGQSSSTPKGDPKAGAGSGSGGNVDSSGGNSPSGNGPVEREGGDLDNNNNPIPGSQNGEPKIDKDGNLMVNRNGTPSSSPGATRPTSSEPRLTGTQPGGLSSEVSADRNNTTSSNLSSAITTNRQKSRRAGEAAVLAAFAAQRNKKPLGAVAMQTAGYSYNKALTFFAEQLKRKYIEEEVVNPENQPMTKSEISHRDRIRHKSPAKDARPIKGSDTKENAEYRLATYITMRGRKGKKKENK